MNEQLCINYVSIMHQKTNSNHTQAKEPTNYCMKETKQRKYVDANKLANVRSDVSCKK